jgi:uncharacterized membrane protein HdeD (DUF308 family)
MTQADLRRPELPLHTATWGALAIRGILAVLFGLVALIWPDITVTALVLLFGAYAFVDGIFAIVAGAWRAAHRRAWWWAMLLEGVLGIVVGVLTFVRPDITALALLYLVAAWAIIAGILEVAAAIWLRRVILGEWALIVGGVLSLIFGLLLIVWPDAGLLTLVWLIGIYAIVFGVMFLVLAYRVRRYASQSGRTTAA